MLHDYHHILFRYYNHHKSIQVQELNLQDLIYGLMEHKIQILLDNLVL